MSKLSKLIKHPFLFLKDMVYNFVGITPSGTSTLMPTFVMGDVCNDGPVRLVLHSGESLNAGLTHVMQWISVFKKADINFIILVRNLSLYRCLVEKYPSVQIVYAKSAIDIENFLKIQPEIRYVFYSSSTGNNIHLARWNQINHIFIGHGDSDKASSAHKGLRLYDEVWVAGQAHIDRFTNARFNITHMKFVKVGRPNLKCILARAKRSAVVRGIKKVLYLPTWEGGFEDSNYSSMCLAKELILLLGNEFDIELLIKFHPLTGVRNAELKERVSHIGDVIALGSARIKIFPSTENVTELIKDTNVFICDVSAVVSECLAGNGPIFIYLPLDRELMISSSNMPFGSYCYTFSSVQELQEKLGQVLSGDDYLLESRREAMDYFIGYEETIKDKFIYELKNRAKVAE